MRLKQLSDFELMPKILINNTSKAINLSFIKLRAILTSKKIQGLKNCRFGLKRLKQQFFTSFMLQYLRLLKPKKIEKKLSQLWQKIKNQKSLRFNLIIRINIVEILDENQNLAA